jgi:galactose mutarotase-like enzyme
MSVDRHVFRSEGLVASVLAQGAELCSLKNDGGEELIWQAGPEWPRHAPLLFPIVGRLKNDELRHRGKSYGMTQHGFCARSPLRMACPRRASLQAFTERRRGDPHALSLRVSA